MKRWKCLWMLAVFSLLLGVETSFALKTEDDWPRWRGQNQDGKSAQKGVLDLPEGYGLKVVWKQTLGSGYSSVSVAGHRAVTMFSDGSYDYLIALDAHSGKELWRYKIDSTYRGHDNSHDGPIATPVIDDDLVFGLGRKGQILALDAEDGKVVWSRNLRTDFNSEKPHHGFGTSPLVYGNTLLLQAGGREGKSVAALDKKTGETLWTNEKETIRYQSPILVKLGGEEQVVCIGNQNVFGLAPQSGQLLWKYTHNLGTTGDAVPVGGDRLFLTSNGRESIFVEVKNEGGDHRVEELWRTRGIRQTFSLSVPYQNYIYGYSNRFLTCIDSNTGKTVWKSRPPGVGFLIFVDPHLVVLTREGTLHVSEASQEGYREKARLKVFEPFTWTPPSFANGKIYARSLQEVACIGAARLDERVADTRKVAPTRVGDESAFFDFIERLERAPDKEKLLDEFMSALKRFPIIENDTLIHVVYRGDVEDLAIRGDMLDSRVEVPMNRVQGTNFYYYSFTLESDARINYQLIKNLEEPVTDPLNSRKVPSRRGQLSEIAMPKWILPKHLSEPAGKERGTTETIQFESKILENDRTVQIYLPFGYSENDSRYPVVYVNFGKRAVEWAKMPNTLDHLIGRRIPPVIAVFVHLNEKNRSREYTGALRDQYTRMLAEELVPYIDQNYRTEARVESRAIMGPSEGGFSALYSAFKHPGIFGLVGAQSAFLRSEPGEKLRNLVETGQKLPVRFYLEWGKYDERVSEYGHTNRIRSNRALVRLLKEKGYVLTAVEVNEGFGWASWRNRTDQILETFFPLDETGR